ncbi:MAG TPA: hypothetical protein DCY88_17505 [Cyanobacteria bacterium UBA11372]|nr:hypothetical protein [Cyanobacteria bacterium UBA11372]
MNLLIKSKLFGISVSRTASVLGTVGLSAIALFSVAKPTNAVTVTLGSDYFVTQSGSSFNFPGIGNVNFQGNPIGTFQGRNVGAVDTIIQRTQDVDLSSGSGTTPINVAALSLKSIQPVTLSGLNYDLFVNLTPNIVSGGTLTINSNETFTNDFTVNFTVSFQPQGSSNTIPCPVDSCDFSTDFATNSGQWSSTFQGGTIVEGSVGDQFANVHTDLPSDTTDFFTIGETKHDAKGAGHHNVSHVPEPLTIVGSGIAVAFGMFVNKEYSKKRKKQAVS